jgi:hypothetical protein
MSFSDEAIINFLLHETMKVERKEFEGQKRSNENDIIQHRRKLAQEHVCSLTYDVLSILQFYLEN